MNERPAWMSPPQYNDDRPTPPRQAAPPEGSWDTDELLQQDGPEPPPRREGAWDRERSKPVGLADDHDQSWRRDANQMSNRFGIDDHDEPVADDDDMLGPEDNESFVDE